MQQGSVNFQYDDVSSPLYSACMKASKVVCENKCRKAENMFNLVLNPMSLIENGTFEVWFACARVRVKFKLQISVS